MESKLSTSQKQVTRWSWRSKWHSISSVESTEIDVFKIDEIQLHTHVCVQWQTCVCVQKYRFWSSFYIFKCGPICGLRHSRERAWDLSSCVPAVFGAHTCVKFDSTWHISQFVSIYVQGNKPSLLPNFISLHCSLRIFWFQSFKSIMATWFKTGITVEETVSLRRRPC